MRPIGRGRGRKRVCSMRLLVVKEGGDGRRPLHSIKVKKLVGIGLQPLEELTKVLNFICREGSLLGSGIHV
jgi:hypothetical protein